MEDTLAKV